MGYTPLFDTLTQGTLCGRWPDIGLWPIVLSMADRNGVVDVTPTYIASITGLGLDEVVSCMERFCEPDPYSRSQEEGGARLKLLDEHRNWGWRVVNHGRYREKARKQAHDVRRQESGENAERMRARREATRRDPTRPAITRSPNSNTNSNKEKNTSARSRPHKPGFDEEKFEELKAVYPKRAGTQSWSKARRALNARLREGSTWNEIIEGAKRYAYFCHVTDKTGTEFVQQAATFCGPDKHYLEPWAAPPANGHGVHPISHKTADELEAEARARGEDIWAEQP